MAETNDVVKISFTIGDLGRLDNILLCYLEVTRNHRQPDFDLGRTMDLRDRFRHAAEVFEICDSVEDTRQEIREIEKKIADRVEFLEGNRYV